MFGVKDKGETSCLIDTCIREFLLSDKATKNYRPSKFSNPVMAHALQNLSRVLDSPATIFQIKMTEASYILFCDIGEMTDKW